MLRQLNFFETVTVEFGLMLLTEIVSVPSATTKTSPPESLIITFFALILFELFLIVKLRVNFLPPLIDLLPLIETAYDQSRSKRNRGTCFFAAVFTVNVASAVPCSVAPAFTYSYVTGQ